MKLKDVKVGMRVAVMHLDGENVEHRGTVQGIAWSNCIEIIVDSTKTLILRGAVNLRPLKPRKPSPFVRWVNVYADESGFVGWTTFNSKKSALASAPNFPKNYKGTFKMVRAKNQEE